jgi:hypothetical protein
MTVDDVVQRLIDISAKSGDSEIAHHEEDILYFDVLRAIAGGATNAQELAKNALRTRLLTFERWYA